MSRPDIVNELPDGRREEIRIRRIWGPGRPRAQTIHIRSAEGRTLEVWHEAFDFDGSLRHRHMIYPTREEA